MGRRNRTIILTVSVAALLALCTYLSDDEYPPIDYADQRQNLRRLLADEGIDASDGDGAVANKGPWTEEEHGRFLEGLAHFGAPSKKKWNRVSATFVGTRSGEEVRAHWQEFAVRRDDPDYLPHAPGDGAAANEGPWTAGWTAEEHDLFLRGLGTWGFGRPSWERTAETLVRTRTLEEVEEHAREYFAANARGEFAPTELFGWPAGTHVAPGTYLHEGRSEWRGEELRFRKISRPNPDYGRVLLYISSHFSEQHEMYLRYCWKNIMARSPLLQEADVAVHLNPNKASARKPAMDLLKDVFEDHNLMVYVRDYEDALLEGGTPKLKVKQTGAAMAMIEAVQHKYFEGYDWVVRVNPDVLVRDDSYLREAMADPRTAALLVNCRPPSRGVHLHTDFFVVRPGVLREEDFPREILAGGAEMSFTTSMAKVLEEGGYEWIPDAGPARNPANGGNPGCRVGAGRDFFASPVVHEHALHPAACTVPEGEASAVEAAFPDGWPRTWKKVETAPLAD